MLAVNLVLIQREDLELVKEVTFPLPAQNAVSDLGPIKTCWFFTFLAQ